jgi:farnesyl-diphosphate farnesyltransferase
MDSFLAGHLSGVSRTYALLIPMLPNDLAEAVGVAYLLMRVVDTVEDAPELTNDERRARLAELDQTLAGLPGADRPAPSAIGESDAERALMRDLPPLLARVNGLVPEYREAVRTCARTMIRGVGEMLDRSAARGVPYPGNGDAAELRLYCYYVAGVVGEMLCAMMAHYLRQPAVLRLHDVAIELGIGLQLVNILKDCLKDSNQGRRYLPSAGRGGVSHTEIYRAVLQEARASLKRGTEFVLGLPAAARELRWFCGLPIAWGALTLARAERSAHEAKIGRGVIRASIDRFKKLAGDDQALRGWFATVLRSRPSATGAAAIGST